MPRIRFDDVVGWAGIVKNGEKTPSLPGCGQPGHERKSGWSISDSRQPSWVQRPPKTTLYDKDSA